MNDQAILKHRDLTETVIRVFYDVYNELGHGFIESVYHRSFELALRDKGLEALSKIEVPVWFRGHDVGKFEADLLVERCLFLELKAVRSLDNAHVAQLLNYLRATDIEIGLLFNFGLRPEFKRLSFDNQRKVQKKASLYSQLLNAPEKLGHV